MPVNHITVDSMHWLAEIIQEPTNLQILPMRCWKIIMDFMRLREHPNEPIVPEIRPDQEDRMARLRQLERRLTNGRITPMEFIEKNTHSADGVIQQAIDARRR